MSETIAPTKDTNEQDNTPEHVKKLLLDFYSKQENMNLIDYYSRTTYFDLIQKSRSETVHSAFLKWILDGSDFPNKGISSNLMHFLQMLVNRHSGKGQTGDFDKDLEDAICTGSLVLSDIAIETEKPIQDFFDDANSKDRLDIYIQCSTNLEKKPILEIFIENKVGSTEGGPHDEKSTNGYDNEFQTERYYNGCHDDSDDKMQLFVYLTAISKTKLDSILNDYSNHQKNSIDQTRPQELSRSDRYIQICYQDILDKVLLPLRLVPYISSRTSSMIEEYISCLGIPAIEDSDSNDSESNDNRSKKNNSVKKQIIMAIPEKERKELEKFFNDNPELLKMTLDVVALKKIYLTDGLERTDIAGAFEEKLQQYLDNTNYSQIKTLKIKGDYIIKKVNKEKNSPFTIDYDNLSKIKIRSELKEFIKRKGYGITRNSDTQSLLEDFWQKNSTLLLTALKVLSDNDTKDKSYYEDCYKKLTARDLSKFTINDEDGLGKTDVLERFIKHLLDNDKPADKGPCEFVNEYLQDVSRGSKKLGVMLSTDRMEEQRKIDKARREADSKLEKSILASNRYREIKYNDEVYYISTQWGGQYNSNPKDHKFPRLWKKIIEYNKTLGKDHPFIVELTE